jgi:hypothetical protein
MTKGCLRTLSLAIAVTMTMAPVMAPVTAQARLDPSTISVAPATIAGSSQSAGLQQTKPLPGVQPMQNGGDK